MARCFIPTLNHVLIEIMFLPSKTTADILFPESFTKLNSGNVVIMGPGAKDKAGKLMSLQT
ncbi:hypothetical protein C1H46_037637 [Malus baccata]|uniref:Uncharacterized protein n=1 Tax=Malus baccata TaxID=106549 RepID=A0A540KRH6_MALBA|nr:hypothetical protein C1H46_037637 [Malus baccata]